MNTTIDLTNHFIVAMPTMRDPNFERAVTLICEHNAEGAVGIVINRPLNLKLEQIFDQMNITSTSPTSNEITVLFGGPLQQERGFVVHPPFGSWRSTIQISDNICITTSQDILEAMARGEGPERSLVTLGCAGWASQQLEQELQENAWFECEANEDILFSKPFHQRWEATAQLLGFDMSDLSGDKGHA